MALTPGTRLGPYEIAAQIGVGGMGEVYRATDTKLKREVAVKVLPASLASDPERAIIVGLAAWSLWPSAEPRSVNRFDYDLPDGHVFRSAGRPVMAFSPDGRHFVYNTRGGLHLRSMGALETRLIPGTESGLTSPFFSPDGESVGYFQQNDLKRIAITGGAPVIIGDATIPFGASWGPDDTILFAQPNGILRVSANGGTPELVIPAAEGELMYGPQLLPDGESVLFSVTTATGPTQWDQAQIVVQSLGTGERTAVLQGGSDARYVPTGHLVYALGNGLFVVAFDADRLEVRGGPVSMVEGLRRANGAATASANYGISDQGTLTYLNSLGAAPREFGLTAAANLAISTPRSLVWIDREGREEPLPAPPRPYSYPRLSPDGTQVAVDVRGAEGDIWVWHVARETLTRLTFDPGQDRFPLWSPDGRRIAFSSQRDGSGGVPFWQAADGTGQAERLAESSRQLFPTSFSPDGTRLLVYGATAEGQDADDNIGIVSLGAESQVSPLVQTTFNERNGEVSPDGRWLAYESDESGQNEIYVRPFPEVDGGRWQVSTGGGAFPLWAPNGRELFYRSDDALMGASIETGESFVAGNSTVLFEGQYAPSPGGRNYDVSPDGRRFLMLRETSSGSADQDPPPRFIVVQNWFEELRRLVPTN